MTNCDVLRPRPVTRQNSSRLNWPAFPAQGEVVGDSALLAGLSLQQSLEIFAYARVKQFARNESLFSQDEPIHKLIMIRTGSVKLTQLSSDGREVILWLNGPGDAVGIHADGSNHSCSARAMERCQVLVWDAALLKMLMSRYPQIQINLQTILAGRLIELEERFREIASERVPKRLALVLMRLLKSVGKESREGVELVITREELAQMTGTTLFTISRIVSKWASFGLIIPRREGVVIVDADRLRRHAELDSQDAVN